MHRTIGGGGAAAAKIRRPPALYPPRQIALSWN